MNRFAAHRSSSSLRLAPCCDVDACARAGAEARSAGRCERGRGAARQATAWRATCSTCGGDGTPMYTRTDRKVTSPAKLKAQVAGLQRRARHRLLPRGGRARRRLPQPALLQVQADDRSRHVRWNARSPRGRCRAETPRATGRRRARTTQLALPLPGWAHVADRLAKTFRFANYHETIAFVNAVAWIAHRDGPPSRPVGALRSLRRVVVDARRRRHHRQRPHLRSARRAPARLTRSGAPLGRPPQHARRPASDRHVVAAHRRHYAVVLDDGERVDCVLKGRRATHRRAATASRSRASPAAARSRRSCRGPISSIAPTRSRRS